MKLIRIFNNWLKKFPLIYLYLWVQCHFLLVPFSLPQKKPEKSNKHCLVKYFKIESSSFWNLFVTHSCWICRCWWMSEHFKKRKSCINHSSDKCMTRKRHQSCKRIKIRTRNTIKIDPLSSLLIILIISKIEPFLENKA